MAEVILHNLLEVEVLSLYVAINVLINPIAQKPSEI